MDFLLKLNELVSNLEMDYQVYFRKRGLSFRQAHQDNTLDLKEALKIPDEIVDRTPAEFRDFVKEHAGHIKKHFLEILMSPLSSEILYRLYCSPANGSGSILTTLFPTLGLVAGVIRGGPNIYKLNGWLVHVLVGYNMVTRYIPAGLLPPTRDWPLSIKNFFKEVMQPIYSSLSHSLKMMLHVGMFSHDIGVSLDIADHNMHGAPMVPGFLEEINITEETLLNNGCDIPHKDFVWATQALVQFHAFINQVGGEFSKHCSAEKTDALVTSASPVPWRLAFLQDHFASMLLLIAVGDLIAVNDTLLSQRKMKEMRKGYDYLYSILRKAPNDRNAVDEGFERFQGFLSDRNYGALREDLEKQITLFDYSPDEFWTKFYHIKELNFALSIVSHLPTAAETLLTFLLVFWFIDKRLGSGFDIYKKTRAAFDHRLEAGFISSQLKEFQQTTFEKLRASVNNDKWMVGRLEFSLKRESHEKDHFVYIRGE